MDALQIATAATQGFGLFQCEECANNVEQALMAAGLPGERIELRAGQGRQFMACLSYDGGRTSITLNGRHLGIRVGRLVFDNLHTDGLGYDEWLRDFDAPLGVVVYRVDSF
ncbi:MAG: hypothetical protein L0Y71_06150 [Gemmataceae bacterium]|nr:hypothetical protein [Gemmataceae bacterium]